MVGLFSCRASGWKSLGTGVLILVALLAVTTALFGEDAADGAGDESAAAEGGRAGIPAPGAGETEGAAAATTDVEPFAKAGKKAVARTGEVSASVDRGVLTVTRGDASLAFEYTEVGWGGKFAKVEKGEASVGDKAGTTDRGAGVKEVVKIVDGGFENDIVFASAGGAGDLALRGRIDTALTLEETFLREGDAAAVAYRGDLIFLNGSGERVLSVGRTWVRDASGRSEVCEVVLEVDKGGVAFETRVPEAWLAKAAWPVTVDPVIGSPTHYGEGGNLDDWPADVAYGSNVYFMVFLVKVSATISDIRGRIFNSTGTGGGSFLIYGGVELAADPRVVWVSGSSGVFAIGSAMKPPGGNDVLGGRRFNSSGGGLGSWYTVSSSSTTTQVTEFDVASNGTNRILYTWGGATSSGIHQLYGEVRSDTGALIKDDTLLETASGNTDLACPEALWSAAAGGWTIAYDAVDGGAAGTPHEVRATNWSVSLTTRNWGPVAVAGGAGESHERAGIAYRSSNGEVLAVWTKTAGAPAVQEVRGRRMSSAGALLGSEFAVESGADQSRRPCVAYTAASDRYVVLFEYTADAATTGGISGQVVLGTGDLWQGRFQVQDDASYRETGPCVARGASATHEFLSAWRGKPNNGTDSETWVVMLDISPPAVPTGLAATAGDAQVSLAWNAVGGTGVAGYHVYVRPTAGGAWVRANASIVTTPNFIAGGLTNGTSYDFAVSSQDINDNESALSSTVSATPVDSVPPAAPTGLGATTASHTVNLTWAANSETDLAGYDVYRAPAETGPWTKINPVLLTAPAYSDAGLTNGVVQWYYVVAKDTSGNASLPSARVSATPGYSIPAGLTHDADGFGSVSMHWSAVVEPDLAGYNVYRGTVSGGPYTLVTPSPVAGLSWTDMGVEPGTYYYVVTARSTGVEESGWSNQISGSPAAVPVPTLDASNVRKTNDATPLITGTSAAGLVVRIYEGGTLLGTGTAGAGGSFAISASALAEGPHVIQATATAPGGTEPTSGLSAGVTVTVDLTPPAPPGNVRVSEGNGWIEIRWDANDEEDLLGYNLYRRTVGGTWGKLNVNPLVNPRYLDRPVANGVAYEYKVTAVDDAKDED